MAFTSPKIKSPTKIVLTVNKESIVPELTANPNLEVTKPKVMKTRGEISRTATNHGDVNLSSLLAHIALVELATTATNTATMI